MDSDPSNKESVDGEKVGENPDDVDKGAVADKEVGPPSPSCLPHVQAVDVLLKQKKMELLLHNRMFFSSR